MIAGDKKKIEDLYLQMYELLFEYARSSLERDALAEEAVQDTFIIACQKAEELLNSSNPKGWLVNTLKNVMRNTIRSQSIAKRILEEYMALRSQELMISQNGTKLELLYDDLSTREEFILLREMAIEGRSYAEMAQSRGISLTSCRKRVQRAREFLQKKIEI